MRSLSALQALSGAQDDMQDGARSQFQGSLQRELAAAAGRLSRTQHAIDLLTRAIGARGASKGDLDRDWETVMGAVRAAKEDERQPTPQPFEQGFLSYGAHELASQQQQHQQVSPQ